MPQVPTASAEKTLELLWTRIRQRGNLPGFSKVVSAILGAMRGDDDREFSMTKTVLSDPALTQRVLRLANSAMYSVFGQNINTVSKAVIVLGTEAIGHLALGLRLVDGLSSATSQSDSARAEMEKAVLAGHIARHVASTANTRDIEEVVVCSMLHSLGRMMAVFYLPELWSAVQTQMNDKGIDEDEAARAVMGVSLDELGRQIAKQWGFPKALVDSMQHFPPASTSEPLSHGDWLAAVSTMSTDCAEVLTEMSPHGSADETDARAKDEVAELVHGYTNMLGLDSEQIMSALEAAKLSSAEESHFARPAKPAETAKNAAIATPAGVPPNSTALLKQGVADMHGIAASANSAQMVAMALETVYKGLGLSRAISFLLSPDQTKYIARLCFGDGVQDLIPQLIFNSEFQPDVFHAALANNKIVFVENTKASMFVNKMPRWWKENLPGARGFILLPLKINRQPVGFIYGDWDTTLPEPKISKSDIPALEELRSMLAYAIEHRRKLDPKWMV